VPGELLSGAIAVIAEALVEATDAPAVQFGRQPRFGDPVQALGDLGAVEDDAVVVAGVLVQALAVVGPDGRLGVAMRLALRDELGAFRWGQEAVDRVNACAQVVDLHGDGTGIEVFWK